jgi:hypothetical protein
MVTLYAVLASLAVGAVYVLVWRLPFYHPLRTRSTQMLIGGAAAVALVCLFAWAQAKLLLWPFSPSADGSHVPALRHLAAVTGWIL